MGIEYTANQDFDRARMKAFWRRVLAWMKGEKNELLPFDTVKEHFPIRGQHDIGMQTVPINNIVGSLGRYGDFDRAFLPKQTRTKSRWTNIDMAHIRQEELPAIELFKIGDAYFVKDGNHRVSVARERGQEFIDAHVIEIEIPVPLSPDIRVDELAIKQEYASFIETTLLLDYRPEADLETNLSGQYIKLLDHIAVHRWFLGEQGGHEIGYQDAVISWYDTVYTPVVAALREHNLQKAISGLAEADLYLWVMEYQWYLRETYQEEDSLPEPGLASVEESTRNEAVRKVLEEDTIPPARKLINAIKRAAWLDELSLNMEWASFNRRTNIANLCPSVDVRVTLPGQYEKLLEHINRHRWLMGAERGAEVTLSDAVQSWCMHVYSPLTRIIWEQHVLDAFPGRTETDLYLWIIEHRGYLQEEYGHVSLDEAVKKFVSNFGKDK